MYTKFFALLFVVCFTRYSAHASVTVYQNQSQWNAAVNNDFDTIFFTELPHQTFVTNQYYPQGVFFTDGVDLIDFNPGLFLNDGWGLYGAIQSTTIQFSNPINWLAHWYRSGSRIELYYQGAMFYLGPALIPPGQHHFAGYVSSQPFDKVRIFNPLAGEINIDDLYFQSPIPAPGVLALLAMSAIGYRRRRCGA